MWYFKQFILSATTTYNECSAWGYYTHSPLHPPLAPRDHVKSGKVHKENSCTELGGTQSKGQSTNENMEGFCGRVNGGLVCSQ